MTPQGRGFENEAEFDKYIDQIFGQIRLPTDKLMSQVMTMCFDIIEQHLPEAAEPRRELSLKQIAFIYIYNNKIVEKRNANSIAKEYGFTSGAKLYDHYRNLVSKHDRLAIQGRETANRLKDLAAVKSLLEGDALKWLESEERAIRAKM